MPGIAGRIPSILDRKSQVILNGPPGAGKTYWAERAARDLAAIAAFGKPYQATSEAEKREIVGTDQRSGLVRWCCFHAGYRDSSGIHRVVQRPEEKSACHALAIDLTQVRSPSLTSSHVMASNILGIGAGSASSK